MLIGWGAAKYFDYDFTCETDFISLKPVAN